MLNAGLEKLEELLEVHNVGDSPITMRQLPEDEEDYQLLLKSMENRQEYRFVIDCNPEKIPKIFKEALGVKLMGDYQVINIIEKILEWHEIHSFE